jgi:hypothetical protein
MMVVRLGRGLAALRSIMASAMPAVFATEDGMFLLAAQDGRLLSLE